MKISQDTTNELMDFLAEIYCHAVVETQGEPNEFELPRITREVNDFVSETFVEIMEKYEQIFNEKWEIEIVDDEQLC